MVVQALWALAAVQKSLVLGRKQAASAIMNTLKKHCTKPYNRKLYDQFPNLCDQLIRLCNHQPPAKAKSVPPHASPLLLLLLLCCGCDDVCFGGQGWGGRGGGGMYTNFICQY